MILAVFNSCENFRVIEARPFRSVSVPRHEDKSSMMRTASTITAAPGTLVVLFLLSLCSISALGSPPHPRATLESRLQDTASAEAFGPDLERAVRQFQAHAAPKAQTGAPLQIGVVFHVLSG